MEATTVFCATIAAVCECNAGEREKAAKTSELAITVPKGFFIVIGVISSPKLSQGEIEVLGHCSNVSSLFTNDE